jgi:predicted lipoprotein with Yx(FWY)xxD motif
MVGALRAKSIAALGVAVMAALALSACGSSSAPKTIAKQPVSFLAGLGSISQIGSTVPANGDINPYGVAVVTASTGTLVQGSTLVSNFNDGANVQGTGSTIVQISPSGAQSVFAKITSLPSGMSCPGGIGLSTALTILPGGWVVVGSVPAAGPSGAPASENPQGCLIVLNSSGVVVKTWSNANINGPWDLTSTSSGTKATIFLSNSLSRPSSATTLPPTGLCTIVRLDVSLATGTPTLDNANVIGKGFAWMVNPAAFVLSPTGLALAPNGTLYVAETLGNHITSIPKALTRTTAIVDGTHTLTTGGALDEPLGLVLAPNNDLIAFNGANGNAVEITPKGKQLKTVTLVANGAGALFGASLSANGLGLVFVNDSTNALDGDVAPAAQALQSTTLPSLGSVLTGFSGRTLYYLSTETPSSLQCTGSCTTTWPPLEIAGGATPTLASGVAGELTTLSRSDGSTQLVYDGHPVYYYSGDSGVGQSNGQGVDGTWFVMSVAAETNAVTTTTGGSGY